MQEVAMNLREPSHAETNHLVALFNAGRLVEMEVAAHTLAKTYPQSGFAWKAYGTCLQAQGKDSSDALRRALTLVPNEAEIYNNLGNMLCKRGQLNEAVKSYRRTLEIQPGFTLAHCGLGIAQQSLGNVDEAIADFRRALSLDSNYADAHNNLGSALRKQGLLEEALGSYRRALVVRPEFAEAYNNLGNVLCDIGRFEDAVCSYRHALKIKGDFAEAQNNLGNVLRSLGRFEDAVENYRQVLEIKADFAEAYCNLGNMLRDVAKYQEGIECCRHAIILKPDFAEAYNNLGNVLCDMGLFAAAAESLSRSLEINSDYVAAYCNLGNVLWRSGRTDDALAICKRAVMIDSNFATAHNNLGTVLRDFGLVDDAVNSFRRAIEIDSNFVLAHQNLLMAMQFLPNAKQPDIFAAHLRFGQQFEQPSETFRFAHSNNQDPNRRLRIGYVSGDFRTHAVAYFIEPVLANHDKSKVEIFCYSNNVEHDAVTDRLIAAADHWIPCRSMSDNVLAQRIRDDGIDILVDLAGHTAHNRLLVFARKPAPIQITYLGYPNTSGLSSMDYRLTDQYTEPEGGGADQYYSEKLVRLPDSVWCYCPTEDMPEVNALPAFANGYLTFGAFNNVNKIGEECIALWAELLRRLPSSRLLMITVPEGELRERLSSKFMQCGVSVNRIDFCGSLPSNEFQRKLQQVDITLDPFPVNGATTTCESLWMGVPVLSMVGERFLSRAGLSVLSSAGLPEFATTTSEEYFRVAVTLANDLPKLAEIRVGLRERLKRTPLLDQQRFIRNLEGIYRDMWHRYIAVTHRDG